MKKLLVSLLVLASVSSHAGTEVVCDTKIIVPRSHLESSSIADHKKLNDRIKELETKGKIVTVTSITSSTGGNTHRGEGIRGAVMVDRVCAVLKY